MFRWKTEAGNASFNFSFGSFSKVLILWPQITLSSRDLRLLTLNVTRKRVESAITTVTVVSSPSVQIWAGFWSCGHFWLVIRTIVCQLHNGSYKMVVRRGFTIRAGTIWNGVGILWPAWQNVAVTCRYCANVNKLGSLW